MALQIAMWIGSRYPSLVQEFCDACHVSTVICHVTNSFQSKRRIRFHIHLPCGSNNRATLVTLSSTRKSFKLVSPLQIPSSILTSHHQLDLNFFYLLPATPFSYKWLQLPLYTSLRCSEVRSSLAVLQGLLLHLHPPLLPSKLLPFSKRRRLQLLPKLRLPLSPLLTMSSPSGTVSNITTSFPFMSLIGHEI